MQTNKLLQTIFYAPYIFLKKCLNAFPDKHPASEYPYRIINVHKKKSTYYFSFQITNTRATFKANLREVFMSPHILQRLTPSQIFKVGYYVKQNEINRINNIKNSRQKLVEKYSIQKKLSSPIEAIFSYMLSRNATRDHAERSYYKIESSYITNRQLNLTLRISDTSMTFDIPFVELLKDFALLKKVRINDLINVGYILKEKESEIDTTWLDI